MNKFDIIFKCEFGEYKLNEAKTSSQTSIWRGMLHSFLLFSMPKS